jgi:hypothetical protein
MSLRDDLNNLLTVTSKIEHLNRSPGFFVGGEDERRIMLDIKSGRQALRGAHGHVVRGLASLNDGDEETARLCHDQAFDLLVILRAKNNGLLYLMEPAIYGRPGSDRNRMFRILVDEKRALVPGLSVANAGAAVLAENHDLARRFNSRTENALFAAYRKGDRES